MLHVEHRDGGCAVRVEGDMTVYTAAELKPALLALLADFRRMEIDLGAVAEMDTAGLQLLALAKLEAARAGGELRLANHSDAVREALDLCGMVGFFGDPVVIPS